MKPITDKAEIAVDFPNKAYFGAFSRHSTFEVRADAESLALKLEHSGEEHRTAEIHLHYYLLADIISDAAQAMARQASLDESHREPLRRAVEALAKVLAAPPLA